MYHKYYIRHLTKDIIINYYNAFVRGRTIFDAVRTVNDVLDFTEMKGFKGIMSAFDFEKAFDSLRLNFL